jgi:hypothetical protein
MSQSIKAVAVLAALFLGLSAHAESAASTTDNYNETSFMDSDAYDPNAANVEDILNQYDRYYEQETGENPWLVNPQFADLLEKVGGCYRYSCPVFIYVNKAEQHAYLHIDGKMVADWPVSTGIPGRGTPDFDKHPDGRVYNRYTSTKFPGGDYNGLGNMPYAVFIRGGFALHGTPKGNWKRLGHKASHGCIRMHPDNAKWFNQLVRQYGVQSVWITVD